MARDHSRLAMCLCDIWYRGLIPRGSTGDWCQEELPKNVRNDSYTVTTCLHRQMDSNSHYLALFRHLIYNRDTTYQNMQLGMIQGFSAGCNNIPQRSRSIGCRVEDVVDVYINIQNTVQCRWTKSLWRLAQRANSEGLKEWMPKSISDKCAQ